MAIFSLVVGCLDEDVYCVYKSLSGPATARSALSRLILRLRL